MYQNNNLSLGIGTEEYNGAVVIVYLEVIIICRYIFLPFWLTACFVHTNFCDLYAKMVQGQQILCSIVHTANVCEYKILCFGPICRNIKQYYQQKIVTLR